MCVTIVSNLDLSKKQLPPAASTIAALQLCVRVCVPVLGCHLHCKSVRPHCLPVCMPQRAAGLCLSGPGVTAPGHGCTCRGDMNVNVTLLVLPLTPCWHQLRPCVIKQLPQACKTYCPHVGTIQDAADRETCCPHVGTIWMHPGCC